MTIGAHKAYFLFADGRIETDVPPPLEEYTWRWGDFPRASRFDPNLEINPADVCPLTVRTFARIAINGRWSNIFTEEEPERCDPGFVLEAALDILTEIGKLR